MKNRAKQKKIAIILAVILAIQIPLLVLYMIYFLNYPVTASLSGGIFSFVVASIVISILYFYKGPEAENQQLKSIMQKGFTFLEKPWLRQQVETHLVFGPIAKHIKISWFFIIPIIGCFFYGFTKTNNSFSSYSFSFLTTWWLIIPPIYLFSYFSKYKQAAFGWLLFKIPIAVLLILMTVNVLIQINGEADGVSASLVLLLIFLYLPILEFVPMITPYQKYINLTRFVVFIFLYLTVNS